MKGLIQWQTARCLLVDRLLASLFDFFQRKSMRQMAQSKRTITSSQKLHLHRTKDVGQGLWSNSQKNVGSMSFLQNFSLTLRYEGEFPQQRLNRRNEVYIYIKSFFHGGFNKKKERRGVRTNSQMFKEDIILSFIDKSH